MEQNKRERLHILFLMLMSFAVVSWTLNPLNGLVYDDYNLLTRVKFDSYENLFKILPAATYNDRSLRMVFLKLLIQWFNENYVAYHIVFVLFHLWNVYLVYRIVGMIMEIFGQENSSSYGFLAASIFGVYPNGGQISILWISATCDFQCCNFMLLSLWGYLKSRDEKEKYREFYSVFAFVCYFLSLRCKEMSLAFPVILVVYEFALAYHKKMKAKGYKTLLTMLLFMGFYAILLFTGQKGETNINSAYYMDFSPVTMIKDAIKYAALYFDVFDIAMQYSAKTTGIMIALSIFVVLLLYTVVDAILRKKWNTIFALICVLGSLSIVLPMKNTQHRLYLYLPSVFISIYLMLLIKSAVERLKIKNLSTVCTIVIVVCSLMYWAPGVKGFRVWWLDTTKIDLQARKTLDRIEEVPEYTKFYVIDKHPGYDIFSYGPGRVLNLVFNDFSIECEMVEEFPENPEPPYVFVEFEDGKAKEIKRDETFYSKLQIASLSKYEVDSKGTGAEFDVGLVHTKPFYHTINRSLTFNDMKLRLNGQDTLFIRGEDFISFTIPEELRIPDTVIEVSLYSEDAGGESDKILIEVH